MNAALKGISLSHHKAPVEIRELIYLHEPVVRKLMISIKEIFNPSELLIVSTCNRTELYYVSESDLSISLIHLLLTEKGITDVQSYYGYFVA